MSDPAAANEASTPTRPAWIRWAMILVAVIAVVVVARMVGDELPGLFVWVAELGAWGPIAFITLYVIATVLVVPGALVTLAGGALFGVMAGTAYVFAGAVLGSGAAFLIGRYLARDAVEARVARFERFVAVDRAVARDGLKMVLLLRLSPIFPFSLLNYALGLTSVRFRDYMLASFGMLPATLLYVYYGKIAGDLAQLASGVPQERGAAEWGVLLLGLAATLAVTIVVTRSARSALAEFDADADADPDLDTDPDPDAPISPSAPTESLEEPDATR